MSHPTVSAFWSWFAARAADIAARPGAHIDEVAERLAAIDEGLGCELGPEPEGGFGLVVRTEAPELRFAAVRVVDAAPTLPGWTFSAWRPAAADLSGSLRFDKGPEHVFERFTVELREDERFPFLHVALASASLEGMSEEGRMAVGFIALDWILGEKLVEDAVESVDFRVGPDGPIPAPQARAEVERRLALVRARASSGADQWAALEGDLAGKPAIGLVAAAPDLAAMAARPWRVEAHLELRRPTSSGLPDRAEIEELQAVEQRLVAAVGARTAMQPWGHLSHDRRRSSFFQVADPRGLEEAIEACARAAGYRVAVEIYYDARWRAWRGLAKGGAVEAGQA